MKRVCICLSRWIQKNARNKDESGFTLMEIITVIAIMSIIIVMIFGFLVFNVDGLNYGSGQTKEQANLRMTALRVTDEIRNSRLVKVADTKLTPEMDYEIYVLDDVLVLDDGVSTITLSSEGISSAEFELKEQNSRYLLIITLATQGNTLDTEVLLNNIASLEVDELILGGRLGFNRPPLAP